jgi:hypothetical protein
MNKNCWYTFTILLVIGFYVIYSFVELDNVWYWKTETIIVVKEQKEVRREVCELKRERINIHWKAVVGDLPRVEKTRNCKDIGLEIIRQHEIDVPQPPTEIPRELYDSFTMNGTMRVKNWYSYEKYAGGTALKPHWTKALIKEQMDMAETNCPNMGNYPGSCPHILDAFSAFPIANKSGVVIGSESPWAESLLLLAGVKEITTVEYGKIYSEEERIKIMNPIDLAQKLVSGTFEKVDFAFSFSSIEHVGLGRYGDPLDGEGDFKIIEQLRNCIVKPGGYLFVGFGIGKIDCLVYNVHRIYGKRRIHHILAGWRFLGVFGDLRLDREDCEGWFHQPILVLQNLEGC